MTCVGLCMFSFSMMQINLVLESLFEILGDLWVLLKFQFTLDIR